MSTVEALRAQIAAEAEEWQVRRRAAYMLSSDAIADPLRAGRRAHVPLPRLVRQQAVQDAQAREWTANADAIREGLAHQMVAREPCFKCGVRQDVHDEMGCHRWRPAP